ncbi:MAG TPA: aminopeptidase P N-terminal domain-containing protein, partial [Longimicrobiales bacterium]|nr:aminopeptidase P N-terminal domain-containing protein [Longimicrobiales bacterium]
MILPAAPVRFSSRDTEYPYRPDSELYYLTGLTEPGAVAVLRGHADEDRLVLFVSPPDEELELWHGKPLGPEEARDRVGADAVWSLDELEERLPQLLAGSDRLHFRLDADPRCDALVRQALGTARRRGARTGGGPRAVVDPGGILDELRVRKDPEEAERLRRAAGITVTAHREALGHVRPGAGEWEIEGRLEGCFRRLGADGPAYGSIVASGANGCILHYMDNSGVLRDGDLLLVDAGAAVGLYAADVTRTVPVGGRFEGEQRAVYDVVERARGSAVAAVRPGATVADVHSAAVQALVEGLIELEVLGGDPEELREAEAHKPFFPHQTSHWL